MRNEPEVKDGRGVMNPARSHESATRTRSFVKRTRLAMLIVALTAVVAVAAGTAGETNAFALPIPGMDDMPPASSHSRHCALKYAAVLDLTELARRDGKSSSAYQHAFNNVSDKINDCSSAHYAASSFVVVEAATGAGSKS